jgi:pimeloyl-ACP methyl ester carboxylesterase
MPQVRCPVLLLQSDPAAGGGMTDIEVARAVQLLARPSVVRLDGVSHVFHNEAPDKVLAAVNDFLMKIVAST